MKKAIYREESCLKNTLFSELDLLINFIEKINILNFLKR